MRELTTKLHLKKSEIQCFELFEKYLLIINVVMIFIITFIFLIHVPFSRALYSYLCYFTLQPCLLTHSNVHLLYL